MLSGSKELVFWVSLPVTPSQPWSKILLCVDHAHELVLPYARRRSCCSGYVRDLFGSCICSGFSHDIDKYFVTLCVCMCLCVCVCMFMRACRVCCMGCRLLVQDRPKGTGKVRSATAVGSHATAALLECTPDHGYL